MKRILIFSLNYHPFVGGAEIAIREITNRISPSDIEFHLIAYRFDASLPKVERIGNVVVHRVGIGKRGMTTRETFTPIAYLGKVLYIPLAAHAAWRLTRTLRFDAYWAMMTYMLFPIALLRMVGNKTPYFLTLQEGDPFEHVFERAHIRVVLPLLTYALRNAKAIQAISTFLLSWSRTLGYEGEGVTIPNGVDITLFAKRYSEEERKTIAESLQKKEGTVFLVTASRLVHKNGIDTVIRALALLPEHIHFLMYGEGPLEEDLRTLARELSVESRVHFKGSTSHEELSRVYAASDIFIRPSRSEGMGNSFIEAMAAGLPVIATQEGGISDFLCDAVKNPEYTATGWAVSVDSPEDIQQAITTILENPEATQRTIETARRMVAERYSWEPIAKDMQSLMERVVAG